MNIDKHDNTSGSSRARDCFGNSRYRICGVFVTIWAKNGCGPVSTTTLSQVISLLKKSESAEVKQRDMASNHP